MDPTPVSWNKVAKTGAIDGLIEVAPLIGHIPSIFYFDFWIDSVATFDFIWGCGSRWAVAARYALPPTRKRNWYIYPGIA